MIESKDRSVADFAREGFFGQGIGKIILELGRSYRRDDTLLSRNLRTLSREKKMCYRNSAEIALQRPDLTYVEGYAFADIPLPFPVAHAWLVTDDGLVVDPTWDAGFEYFGIPFTIDKLTQYLLLTEEYGFLQSLWRKEELKEAFLADFSLQL
jgi:hypothetical protein